MDLEFFALPVAMASFSENQEDNLSFVEHLLVPDMKQQLIETGAGQVAGFLATLAVHGFYDINCMH